MNTVINRKLAVQRLTALWALSESGLGGVLHAFRMPFTGVVAGGMAIVLLTLIAQFAPKPGKAIITSLMVVLIIKAMVSPHSPFMAYVAVSVQALLAALIYRTLGIHFFSIMLVSLLAMWESALQKLVMLTVFFGMAIWEALDELVAFMAKQTGLEVEHGSFWVATVYVGIYSLSAIFIAGLSYKLWFRIKYNLLPLPPFDLQYENPTPAETNMAKKKPWLLLLLVLAVIAAIFFWLDRDGENNWLRIGKTISWSLASIVFWYAVVNPLLLRLTQGFLKKKESRYTEEVAQTLQLIPALRKLAATAWATSAGERGLVRLSTFVSLLVFWSLLYEE